MQTFNIRFTLDGLNKVIEVLGELPNKSGTFPLLREIEQQAIAEDKRMKSEAANLASPTDSQSTETASDAKTS